MLGRFHTAMIAVAVPLALSACSNSETTPIASTPPPAQVAIPPQPRPPLGAQGGIKPPSVDALGQRQTINAGIPSGQLVWNFRSAYNVAALDCLRPEHAAILANYKTFLKVHNKGLNAANKEVDLKFETAKGRSNVHAREVYMTQVYNFYALPPTLPAFCDAALAVSNESINVAPQNLKAFAAESLPKLDRIFLMFYNSYDQYKHDLAAWQQRYMPTQAPAAPLVSMATPDATTRP